VVLPPLLVTLLAPVLLTLSPPAVLLVALDGGSLV
jgi:hypothetical protein